MTGVRPNSLADENQRLVEQAALLEILDQRGDRLIHDLAHVMLWPMMSAW